MKCFIFAALALVAVTSVAASADFEQFLSFVKTYNKQYTGVEEFEYRFGVFKTSLAQINNLRQQHFNATGESGSDVYTVTKFADLTAAEFRTRYLGFKPNPNRIANIPVSVPAAPVSVPTKFDWRDRKAVTPVKDQADCGSCWAFSATEELESMAFLQNSTALTELSVQQIVSCDTTDGGCDGGDTITAYEYVEKAGGLETGAKYPYTSGGGDNGKCKVTKSDEVVTITGYTYATPGCTDACNNQNADLAVQNLVSTGPISICVNAEPWQFYSSGIMSSGCDHAYSDLDHCVQLVGYDQTGSTPYWIIRNSWNTDWGIDGYIWVSMKQNLCGVLDEATLLTTKKV